LKISSPFAVEIRPLARLDEVCPEKRMIAAAEKEETTREPSLNGRSLYTFGCENFA
jgi:hypothetical protein